MTIHEKILKTISDCGPLPFSKFMEIALYDAEHGFYSTGGAGRKKDFITSPETGPLFGKLVAKAIDQWWIELGKPQDFTFLESGSGPGTLARSILRSDLVCREALNYIAVEISQSQREEHPSNISSSDEMPERIENGIIFANELLDNLPFDIFESCEDGTWKEVRIGSEDGSLTEILLPSSGNEPGFSVSENKVRVPVQKAVQEWLATAFSTLQNGRIVIIDYAIDHFPPEGNRNWLRTYKGHELTENPLTEPGKKDITSDIDISQLETVRKASSIKTQRQWLMELGIEKLVKEGKEYWLENAHNPNVNALEARSRIVESEALLDPNSLGGFKVIEWKVKS